MSTVTNPIQAVNSIFLKPRAVFAAIAERDNWSWVAFFIVMVMSMLPAYLYFSGVDIDWYKNLLAETAFAESTAAEKEMILDNLSRTSLIFQTLVFVPIAVLIVNAIIAVYLNVVTKSDPENTHGFTDWYGFLWWTYLPGAIIAGLIALVMLLMADNAQMSPSIVTPTTLASLLSVDMGSKWFGLLNAIRIETIWTIYLSVVGICQWTRFSSTKALIISIAPHVIIYGIWLLFTAL